MADFDPTRPFRRTSPDNGSMHDYPDMDPTWYARKFPYLPYMSETGMHNDSQRGDDPRSVSMQKS